MRPKLRPILLEGPDGAGKTTLARALAEELGTSVTWNVPALGLAGDALHELYLSQVVAGGIVDRSWPSEDVYGGLFRGGSRLSAGQVAGLFGEFRSRSGLLVLCLPPTRACAEASDRAAKPGKRPAFSLTVWQAYAEVAARWGEEPWACVWDRTKDPDMSGPKSLVLSAHYAEAVRR